MKFIVCVSLLLSLHFHFVKPGTGPVSDGKEYEPFITKLKELCSAKGLKDSDFKYDESIIDLVKKALNIKTGDVGASPKMNDIVPRLSKLGFTAFGGQSSIMMSELGPKDTEFFTKLADEMLELINVNPADLFQNAMYHKFAVLFYFDSDLPVNLRFMLLFKRHNLADYFDRHLRRVRDNLEFQSDELALIPEYNNIIRDYFANTFLPSNTYASKLAYEAEFKAKKMIVIKINVANLHKNSVISKIQNMETWVTGSDSDTTKVLFSKDQFNFGVYCNMTNRNAPGLVILVQKK